MYDIAVIFWLRKRLLSNQTALISLRRDRGLNYKEFKGLCGAIFREPGNKPYHIPPKILKELFDTFDTNRVWVLDFEL